MAIVKTEAVILKCDNYRETSKIITFYTRQFGKIRGIAKGVRQTKSKWGGALQSMAHLDIIIYYKENRTLHLVSGAEHVRAMHQTSGDYDKMKIGFRIVELLNRMTPDEQANNAVFELVAESLRNLDGATKNFVNVLFNYEFKLLKLLGFEIDTTELFNANIDNLSQNRYFYETLFTPGDLKALRTISEGSFNSLMSLNISRSQEAAVDRFFENYFRDHFDHAGFSNTKKVFNSKEMYI